MNPFPFRKFAAVSSCKISLKVLLLRLLLGSLLFAVGYFYCLQSHHRPVNDLSTAVQLTNRLLRFWADGGFVYYKRVSSPSFLVWSQSLIQSYCDNNVKQCIVIITSWFAIALDEIRTRRILREKADCKQ